MPLVQKQTEAWVKSLPSDERKRVQKTSSKSTKNYHALLMSSFDNFMGDGVSMTKTPRELRAEKRSRDKGELVSPTSKNKRAKTKDKTSVSHNLNYKKDTKNKNLDSQDLAINLTNKNKWPITKNKNLDSQDLAINLANKDKRKYEDIQTFEPSKLRQTKARMDSK